MRALRLYALFATLTVQPFSYAQCSFTVASWNVLNLYPSKVGAGPDQTPKTNLLTRYADIMSRYDVIWVQEVMANPAGLTGMEGIASQPAMSNYKCITSKPAGRGKRLERYGLCYATKKFSKPVTSESLNNTYTSIDGTENVPAQDIWMRPPFKATLTFLASELCRDEEDEVSDYTFNLLSSHTKPQYTGPRPSGTKPTTPKYECVYNELKSAEEQLGVTSDYAVIGDLNADCVYYPGRFRTVNSKGTIVPRNYRDFKWLINFGEKTNTAAETHCAYDRIAIDSAMQSHYFGREIYTQGIAPERVDGRRVSDHFLVAMELGFPGKPKKKPNLGAAAVEATASAQQVSAAQQQFYDTPTETLNDHLIINGENLQGDNPSPAFFLANLYVVKFDSSRYFKGNQRYKLEDVRGASNVRLVTNAGTLSQNVDWQAPPVGAYSLILDVNRDAYFDSGDGDIATYADTPDIVVSNALQHSDVVTIDDSGNVRETFPSNGTPNINVIAKGLPKSSPVNVYVVSTKLLPSSFTTWSDARTAGTLDLQSIAIPVKVVEGPIITSALKDNDKFTRVTTASDGTLFVTAWKMPATLLNEQVLTQVPGTPDYKPDYGTEADPCNQEFVSSADANLKAICNYGNLFTDYYGNSFNIVIDTNRNGVFDGTDEVDEHDISDMTKYFTVRTNTVLDARANGDPAVGEWKNYLKSKVYPAPPLDSSDIYDTATSNASAAYLCNPSLLRTSFSIVEKDAEAGFEVLNGEDYVDGVSLGTQSTTYDAAAIHNGVAAASEVCVTGNDLALTDSLTAKEGTNSTWRADTISMKGNFTDDPGGTVCIVGEDGMQLYANTRFTVTTLTDSGFTFRINSNAPAASCTR